MAEFRLGPADFAHIVERRRLYMLRRSGPYPLVSLLAAGVLSIVAAPAALRWGAISVARYPDGFVVSDDDGEILVLPKRHLSTTELLFLKQRQSPEA